MKQKLINLNPEVYEHPFDKAALKKLKSVPMMDQVTNFMLNWTYIKWYVVELCGSNYHVTQKSCPQLYNLVNEVAETLDIDRLPQIYTQWGYFVNAFTTGYKNDTILVLYSGAVDLLNEEELRYIIGHEMGHIKSGHVLYHQMASLFSKILTDFAIAQPFIGPIQLALQYWNRMSEFTADRAGLLASQDLDAALNGIMKMSGLPMRYFDVADHEAFIEQAEEFQEKYSGTTDTIIKNISILDNSHPWTIMRAAELIKWVKSGEYQKILDGTLGKECPICKNYVELEATNCPICGYQFE